MLTEALATVYRGRSNVIRFVLISAKLAFAPRRVGLNGTHLALIETKRITVHAFGFAED